LKKANWWVEHKLIAILLTGLALGGLWSICQFVETVIQVFIIVALLAAGTYHLSQKEKQLVALERNLAQLVDPEVFREIRRLSHSLHPSGQRREITSMFVDMRNFTALAEQFPPHHLTDMLNEFYTEIVAIVSAYRGTVDKFMGDGVLIIFGAPATQENHCLLAYRAALDTLTSTHQLCQRWRNNWGIDTEIGITLNSGPAFVGFFGPADKLQYTGVGDTVNTCVRLQEQIKQFGTRLIFSETTFKGVFKNIDTQIGHEMIGSDVVALGEISVRGRTGYLEVFTLQQALKKQPKDYMPENSLLTSVSTSFSTLEDSDSVVLTS
jgi:class 3 adenylate cyclase